MQGVHRRGGCREEELGPQSCFPLSVPEKRGGAGLWSPSPGAQLDTCLSEFTLESWAVLRAQSPPEVWVRRGTLGRGKRPAWAARS